MLGVVGSADVDGVGSCVQTDTDSRKYRDVQWIMGRVRPIRLCKLTKTFPR